MEHNRVVYERPYDAEVEYLESDGSSYIDTGIKASSDIGVYGTINLTKDSIGNIFGTRDRRNFNEFFFVVKGNSGESSYRFGSSIIDKPRGSFNFLNKVVTISNLSKHNEFIIDTYIYTAPVQTFTCRYNILIYCFNGAGLASAHIDGLRIYNFKIYNLDTLVRDFIPVRKGTIGYMYDKVSKKLFANKGTGNFILGQDVANPVPNIRRVFRFGNKRFVMPMPYDSKIEYLESTGTQYIDTGVIIDSETAFAGTTVDFQAVNINNGTCVIAGSVLSEGANRYKNLNLLVYNNKFYIDGAGWRFNNNINNITLRTIATATGTAKGISRKQFLLFARYVVGLGASTSNSGCRIFSCKIYKNEILICDLIPVRRGNVGYMYDRVSGRLFGNSGTGQFILGNDIND